MNLKTVIVESEEYITKIIFCDNVQLMFNVMLKSNKNVLVLKSVKCWFYHEGYALSKIGKASRNFGRVSITRIEIYQVLFWQDDSEKLGPSYRSKLRFKKMGKKRENKVRGQ